MVSKTNYGSSEISVPV